MYILIKVVNLGVAELRLISSLVLDTKLQLQSAAYALHPNGTGECPHQIITDSMCSMLACAVLSMNFWPYAFHQFQRIYNATGQHAEKDTLQYVELCLGSQPDLSLLLMFCC
jgi:hypothetical protein